MENFQLSYSSATLFRGCQQRFYYYKKEVPHDPDYDDDITSFNIGKAFHYILEETLHTKPEKISELLDKCIELFNIDPDTEVPLLHAMVLKYLRLHKRVGLECVGCEMELSNNDFIGYVDAVLIDKDGSWWICDLKTAKTVWQDTHSRLFNDVQLNLYAYFYKEIAANYKLDPKKFKGCRYRVTTKSTAKQRSNEEYLDFVARIRDLVRSYDFIIPIERMNPTKFYHEHLEAHDRAAMILAGRIKPSCNYAYCNSYFKPCPWYSKCHGGTFTENKESIEVVEEK